LWSQSAEIQQRLALARFEPGSALDAKEVEKLAHHFQKSPSEMLTSLPQFDLVAKTTAYDSVRALCLPPGISLSTQELQSYQQELREMRARRPELFSSEKHWSDVIFEQEQQIGLEMLRRGVVPLAPATEQLVASQDGSDILGKRATLLSNPLPSMLSVEPTPLPKSVQDWWQIADWKKRGSPATEFARLAAAIDRTQGATADEHSLGALDLLIYAKNSNLQGGPNSPEAVQAVQHYQQNKDTLPLLGDTLIIVASSPYMTLQTSRYSYSPNSMVDGSLPFEQRVRALGSDLDTGGLRDHLLMRELSRELCSMTGESFSTTVTPVTFSGSLSGQGAVFDVCKAEGFSQPTVARLKGCDHNELLSKVTQVYDLLHSSTDKATVARMALEVLPSVGAQERFELIAQFLPEPSPLRDYFLKRLVAEYPVTLEQIETFRSALTSESLMKNGTVKAASTFQLITMVGSLSGEHRQEVAEWLCGMKNDAPWHLQASAGEYGFSIENQPKLFAALTPDERTAALRALLLDQSEKALGAQDSGPTFRATTLEEKQRLKQFVGNLVDKVIDSHDPAYKHIKMTAELLFEHARPERRLHYFDALSRAYLQTQAGEGPVARGEIVALFLEQTGPLGCKLMQMLSHDKNLPEDLRKAFSDRRSGVSPFSEFAVASRVTDTDTTEHSALTIEKRLGTASMKQAHRVSSEEGHAVLKVLRPTVEKYREEDFAICGIVIDSLRKSGTPIPKHLIASLQEVVREESDLENEARLQRDFKAQVTGQTYNTLSLAVPAVKEAHKDWALEELASGNPLAKTPNAGKEYQDASLAAGSSLLKDILAKRLYHADLHDENIFLDTQKKALTFIDCGAIGQASDETLAFLRAFLKKDARAIIEILSRDKGSANDLTSDHAKAASLQATLQTEIFDGKVSLEERANRLSYTILDSVVPSREIRYLIKALGVGGHHLESLVPSFKDIASPGRLFEKCRVLWSAWRVLRILPWSAT
jgi:predicted unusual protein kinase regulating ubiquinone biosynthesis (AarF/ABC1/UbiB family)